MVSKLDKRIKKLQKQLKERNEEKKNLFADAIRHEIAPALLLATMEWTPYFSEEKVSLVSTLPKSIHLKVKKLSAEHGIRYTSFEHDGMQVRVEMYNQNNLHIRLPYESVHEKVATYGFVFLKKLKTIFQKNISYSENLIEHEKEEIEKHKALLAKLS